jgi:ABC-type phosphate transport system permease subunit
MTIILYLLAIFISLFILYAISRHDFVLLRQSISLRQVFDTVFISLFVFFMTSRIFYILYAQAFDLFNPLKFFYLPKHWGILPYAGLIGIIAAIYLREYASQGVITQTVRIAVNNLAGVPSIVYGVFGLGFFHQGRGEQVHRGWLCCF